MGLKKPSDYFKRESNNIKNMVGNPNLNSYSESFNTFKENLSKFEKITETIEVVNQLKEELQNFLKKEDLDNAMLSYVFLLEESIENLQSNVKSINSKTLAEIKSKVSNVTDVVNEFIEVDIPKYKKNIVDVEVKTDQKFIEFKEEFDNVISQLSDDIDKKQFEISNNSENNLNEAVSNLENHIKDIGDSNKSISNTLKVKVNEIQKLKKKVVEELKVNKTINESLKEKVENLQIELIRGENNLKEQNINFQKIENGFKDTIEKLNVPELEKENFVLSTKIKHLEEVYEKLKEESKINETLIEQTLPSTETSDPLTPLDQNYVTLDQLQQHYRLFLGRIQTQLSTLGGGGETRLQYLDDIVGIATNLSEYDGKFLKVDTSQPAGKNFVFETVSGGGGGGSVVGISTTGGSFFNQLNVSGVSTFSNDINVTGISSFKNIINSGVTSVGIVTALPGGLAPVYFGDGSNLQNINATNINNGSLPEGVLPASLTTLNVTGIGTITTLSATTVSIAGTLTYEDVTNIDSVGLITARNGVNVNTGTATTALIVQGDTRITGILTIGTSSITLNPTEKKISGLDEIQIGTGSTAIKIKKSATGDIEFVDDSGQEKSVGIGTTVSINTSGIITASAFHGDGSALTNLPVGTPDKIEEGDSKVEVTDSGTGQINVVIDGNHFARFTNVSGRKAIFGSNVSVQNNYGSNDGDIIIANGGRRLRLFRTGVGLADDSIIGTIDFAAQQSGTGGQSVSLIESSLRGGVENKSDLIFSTSNGGSPTEKVRIMHTGNVGIGTTNPDASVGAGNTAKLSVGILSAYQLYGDGSALTGISAGGFSQDDQGNLVAGTNAGAAKDADTCFNIMIGCNAGLALCGGYGHSILMGCHTGKSITTGAYNFLFGKRSGCLMTTASYNITLGNNNGTTMTTGCHNIFFGNSIASGGTGEHCNNIIMGQESAYNLDTGNDNIVIGKQAGCDISSGDNNIYLGQKAGTNSTTGSDNIAIGNVAMGYGTVTGARNIAIGCCSGQSITSGNRNIFIGDYAGNRTTSGSNNTILGSMAGCQIGKYGYTGEGNTLIGKGTGRSMGASAHVKMHTFIGCYAGKCVTAGCCNTMLGVFAGSYTGNITGSNNVAIGRNVCLPSLTGSDQLVVGSGSTNWITGNSDFNVGIGTTNPNAAVTSGNTKKLSVGILSAYQLYGDGSALTGISAGFSDDGSTGNLIAGDDAGKCLGGSSYSNLFLGCYAGRQASGSVWYNIVQGHKAADGSASTNLTGKCNIVMGALAGQYITSGWNNILLGSQSGSSANGSGLSGNNNIALGANSSRCMTSGSHNIALGTGSLQCCMSTGLCNIAIGIYAGRKLQNNCNIAIGSCALFGSGGGVGYCNIAIGLNAGRKLTNGHDNIFMGTCAGMHITGSGSADGSYNIGFGREALGGLADGGSTTGNFNAVMGFYSGRKISSGGNNTLMGRNTGCSITSGGSNTFLGLGSGKCVSTGSKNIAIGVNVTPPSDTGSCQLVIGVESSYWMVGNSDFNVGIGTTNPNAPVGVGNTAKLSVGIVSAYQFYGDGSNLTGISGGGGTGIGTNGSVNTTGIITASSFVGDGSGLTSITATGITTISGQLNLNGMSKETINIVANKLSAATDIDLEDGLVHYFSTTETADATPNIRFNSSTTLNSKLSVGDSITVTIISSTNNTNYSYEQLTIDGSAVTEQWIGGAAPSGGSSGYDIYTFQIIKTADATYLVFGNKVNFT